MATPAGRPGGAVPALSAADLLASVPGIARLGLEITHHEVRRVPGAALTVDDVAELAVMISREAAVGMIGAVVVQGTDTIEETAFLLDLLHPGEAPVVVTGAMRHAGMDGADGPANLLAAVITAASRFARGLGCLVVLADEIHAARYVRKAHSTSVAAFISPSAGPLGCVAEGEVVPFTRPLGRLAPALASLGVAAPLARSARIGLLTMSLGDDGELLRAAAGRVDGMVIAGFGVGHVPPGLVPDAEALARTVPVVLASRAGAGPVLREMYGFPGSERDLLSRGLISAGTLDPLKARLLLHVVLASGLGRADAAAAFRAALDTNAPA